MPNLATSTPALSSITADLLQFVSGGCHKRHCCCPPININMQQCAPPTPAPATPALGAPQQMAQADPYAQGAPASPTGDVIMTSVSINGQRMA